MYEYIFDVIEKKKFEAYQEVLPDREKFAQNIFSEEDLVRMRAQVLYYIDKINDDVRPNRKYKDIAEFLALINLRIGEDKKKELNMLFQLSPIGRGTEAIYYFVQATHDITGGSPEMQAILDRTDLWKI